MKDYFEHEYPAFSLSKYFVKFLDKVCHKLGFYLYYEPRHNRFMLTDHVLPEEYKYYKTLAQIKIEKPTALFYTDKYNWTKKHIILFNKEEPYEQNDGEWYYPDHYECNHDLEFKISNPNLQKVLLCIFKNPILQAQHYYIQDLFKSATYDRTFYFPSENLAIEEKLDLLLIRNLDQRNLLEVILKDNQQNSIVNILKKKSNDYLVEFFKSFGVRTDLGFKDFIYKVTNNQDVLNSIFEYLPEYKQFLHHNAPTQFLSHETQSISIYKSFFDLNNLSIRYHEKFNLSNTQHCLLAILDNSYIKSALEEKGIIVHHAFHNYSTKNIISIIENNSLLPIEKIEQFFCDSLELIEKSNKDNYINDNKDKLIKFFNYFYMNELSLNKEKTDIKKSFNKI